MYPSCVLRSTLLHALNAAVQSSAVSDCRPVLSVPCRAPLPVLSCDRGTAERRGGGAGGGAGGGGGWERIYTVWAGRGGAGNMLEMLRHRRPPSTVSTVHRPPFSVQRTSRCRPPSSVRPRLVSVRRSPSTVHRPPYTVRRPLSTVRFPPSTVCRSPPAVHRPPSTVYRPPSAVNCSVSAVPCPPSAVHRPSSAVCRPPSTIHPPPSTDHRPPPFGDGKIADVTPAADTNHFALGYTLGGAGPAFQLRRVVDFCRLMAKTCLTCTGRVGCPVRFAIICRTPSYWDTCHRCKIPTDRQSGWDDGLDSETVSSQLNND